MAANDVYLNWSQYVASMRVFISGATTPKAIEIQRTYNQILSNHFIPSISLYDLGEAQLKVATPEARALIHLLKLSITKADLFILMNTRSQPDPFAMLQLGMAVGKTPVLLIGKPFDKLYMPLVGGVCYTEADFQRFLDTFESKETLKPTSTRVNVSLMEVRYG